MIIFPDIEPTIVAGLQAGMEMVRVGTKKLPADQQPPVQVVVTVSYANEKSVSPVLRYAGIVLDVYADDYASATSTALNCAAILPTLTDENIKKIAITSGPVRMGDDTGQEHRSVSAEVTVKANDLIP